MSLHLTTASLKIVSLIESREWKPRANKNYKTWMKKS